MSNLNLLFSLANAAAAVGSEATQVQAVFEAMPDAIVLIDPAGLIRAVNAHTERLFHYERCELLGRELEILLPKRIAQHHRQLRVSYNKSPHVRTMGDGRNLAARRNDGSEFPVDISLSPVLTTAGQCVLAVIRDATDRKRLESELRDANAQLEARVLARTAELQASNERLDLFASYVSHELRSPLRALQGYADLAIGAYAVSSMEEVPDYLAAIDKAARSMMKMTTDLLVLGRDAHQHFESAEIDTTALVHEIAAQLRVQDAARNLQYDISRLPALRGNSSLIRQLFVNLLSNAQKYSRSRDPAVITIGGRQVEQEIVIDVHDNGIGFDAGAARRLFSPFSRLHQGAQFEGSGIGLYVARCIVERHGGQIWANSEPNQGATFSFSIPQ